MKKTVRVAAALLSFCLLCSSAAFTAAASPETLHQANAAAQEAPGLVTKFWQNNSPEISIQGDFVLEGQRLISYLGEDNDVVIPGNLGITTIASNAFSHTSTMESLVIPEGVTAIEARAFSNSAHLKELTFPDSLCAIGYSAFDNTPWKENLPSGIVYAGKVAFTYKGTMPDNYTLELREDTTGIADYAFPRWESIVSVVLPESLIYIGGGAFNFNRNLTSITFGSNLNYIGDFAFSDCYALTAITLPDSLEHLGAEAFGYCESLASITIPNRLADIGELAFGDTPWLENATPENDIIYAGRVAYEYTGDGTAAPTLRENTVGLADDLFYNKSLSAIELPEGLRHIGRYAFCDSDFSTIALPSTLESIGRSAFYNCRQLTEIAIPDSVTSIGANAFSGCSNLSNIAIGSGTIEIVSSAFRGCNNITISASNQAYKSVDGVIFSKSGKTLTHYPRASSAASYAVPSGTQHIGASAFYDAANLKSITFPAGLLTIGVQAFDDSEALNGTITIPDGVQLVDVHAFSGFDEGELVIPKSVRRIEAKSFVRSSNLTIACYEGSKAHLAALENGLVKIRLLTEGESESFTVTLNATGGSVNPASISVTNGGTYNALPTPTFNGYTFNGWYTAAAGGTKVNPADSVNLTGDITLYAQWSVNPAPKAGIFGTNPKWDGAWWHYILFFVGFGFIWMWF